MDVERFMMTPWFDWFLRWNDTAARTSSTEGSSLSRPGRIRAVVENVDRHTAAAEACELRGDDRVARGPVGPQQGYLVSLERRQHLRRRRV